MRIPMRISFDHVPPSDALAELVRQHVWELQESFPRVARCEVAIADPSGTRLGVRIDLSIPGRWLAVERDAPTAPGGTSAFGLIADTFEAARRELEAFPLDAPASTGGPASGRH